MINFIKKIFSTSPKIIPEQVQQMLLSKFPNAINIEWELKDGHYEAIFYLNEVEYIAKITEKEGIIEYKINLNLTYLPQEIRLSVVNQGEIMNAIAIHRNSEMLYEIIVRDQKLDRTLLLLSASGQMLKSKKI